MLSTAHVSLNDVIEIKIIEGDRVSTDLTYPAVTLPHPLAEVFSLSLARQSGQCGIGESPVRVTCHDIIVPDLTHVSELIHAHHHDYAKPLDVEWLCTRCHGLRHRIAG